MKDAEEKAVKAVAKVKKAAATKVSKISAEVKKVAAKKEVSEVYKSLSPIVKDIVGKHSKELDNIINKIKKNMTTLTNKELQDYMMQLSIETYEFAQSKDMSILMQECAIAVSKDRQANIFNSAEGTQAVRLNTAQIESVDSQVVVALQNAVANCMKSKLDEAHRVINILSNVLISKNAENKLRVVNNSELEAITSEDGQN